MQVMIMQTKLQYLRDSADGQQCLLILDGHQTHYSIDFVRYAVKNGITLLSYPGHTTYPLQPLDVGLFAPLQKAYGMAVYNYARETRTGITKKQFFSFYSQAKRQAYTKENTKAAWRAAGIHPFNPNIVLRPLLRKLRQKQSNGRHVWRPQVNTTLKFLAWKSPQNRHQLSHQSNAAIHILSKSGLKSDSITLIRKLSRQTESAIARAEIAEIGTANIRSKYAGKRAGAGPGGRKKLIKGKIGDWELLKQMEMEEREKDEAAAERAKAKAKRATGRGRGTGNTTRSSGTAKVCSTQIFNTF